MSVTVAIQRDRTSLQLVIADHRATGTSLRSAKRVVLPESEKHASAKQLVEVLRRADASIRWNKTQVVWVVGAEAVQLRQLNLPPAPMNELPDMVRMVATRELSAADEDAIDFMPLSGDATTPHMVLAARLAAEQRQTIQAVADELDFASCRVVLRACAAASLAMRIEPSASEGLNLVIAPAEGGVDMAMIEKGQPVLVRSTTGTLESASGEARRTLSAAAQRAGESVRAALLLTNQSTSPAIDIGIPVQGIDFTKLPEFKSIGSSDAGTDWSGLSGLIGAALAEAKGEAPAIDFLNPRQAETSNAPRRRQLILAGAAALTLLAGALYAYGQLVTLDRDIASLNKQISGVKQSAEEFAPYEQKAELLERWASTDVNWLDELNQLSTRLRPNSLSAKDYPAGEDVLVTELVAREPTDATAGGRIELKAAVRKAEVLAALEGRLRDTAHNVQPISVSDRPASETYNRAFQTYILVTPRTAEAESLPESDAAEPDTADPKAIEPPEKIESETPAETVASKREAIQ